MGGALWIAFFSEKSSRNCEFSGVKCGLETMNRCFALKLAIFTITGDLGSIFAPFWTPLGSQLEASWSRLTASRAALGVFWTVLGRLQVDNMPSGSKIHDFGLRLGFQNIGKTEVG